MSPNHNAEGSLSSCLQRVFFTFAFVGLIAFVSVASTADPSTWKFPWSDCGVSDRFPDEVLQWCGLITKYAHQTDLHPDLVAALIWQESGGNPKAYSRSGAVGLMQVMPRDGIAADYVCKGNSCFSDRPEIRELEDPEFNIQYGTHLLQELVVNQAGDLREALRIYGPLNVGYTYADTVLSIFKQYGVP
jgi:hypothetical protein